MQVSSAAATTSSRLDRQTALSPATAARMEEVSAATITYCQIALDLSQFFTLLKDGKLSPAMMQYAFLQYHAWRDRLHQWFGLCIVKAGSCTDPDQKLAIMSLADHTFTDLQDGHSEMYLEFLGDLGLNQSEIQASTRSAATVAYERSFFDEFGDGTENFYEAMAALSGRELCVSIRNQIILESYFNLHQLNRSTWLTLHAELEVDHFQDAIRPVLIRYAEDSAKIAELMTVIERSIDRHVQYFDDLLAEYQDRSDGN
jgi:pyrroloquinoline quinone (PQQ) biosynthesis protein C